MRLSSENPSHNYFAGYEALICRFVGTIVGWGVGRVVPSFISTGRWMWVTPVGVLLILGRQLHTAGNSMAT
jgi:hypothetical protein